MKIFPIFLLTFGVAFSGVYQIKLLNDNQPDYSDCKSFMNSIFKGQNFTTNQEKAISAWKQVNAIGTHMNYPPNEWNSNYEKDAITYMHCWGTNYCSITNDFFGCLWENYTGQYARSVTLTGHSSGDKYYDNGWHMLDASYSNYVWNSSGKVASSDELKASASLFNTNCPQRTSNVSGDMYTTECQRTISSFITMYTNMAAPQKALWDGSAMNQYTLSVRPYEYFRMYKSPLGVTGDYYVPLMGNGSANTPLGNNSAITNGEWVLEPDLTKADWTDAVFDRVNIAQGGGVNVHPAAAGSDASLVFNVNSYSLVTSVDVTATVVKGASDEAELYLSLDAGKSWTTLGAMAAGAYSKHLLGEVQGQRCYLLKVRLKAASANTSVGLGAIKIRTVTQLNRKTFFALDRGANAVTVRLDTAQLERVELRVNCDSTAYTNYLYSQLNFGACTHGYAKISPLANGVGFVAFKLDAPNDIKHVVMGGNFWRRQASDFIKFYYSIDGGVTWVNYGGRARLGVGDYAGTWGYQGDHFADTAIAAAGVKSVLLKCEITRYSTSSWNGIIDLWCAADYKPIQSSIKPLEVTFNWTEQRRDGTRPARSFLKRISTVQECTIDTVNVAGYRFPNMNYVQFNLQGHNPNGAVNPGYGDATNVGAGDEPEKFTYAKAALLSQGNAVASSVAPSAGTLANLSDEVVKWGQDVSAGSNCQWAAGVNPVLTMDLAASKTVGGVTVFQGAPNGSFSYADSIQVLAGVDTASLAYQGTIKKADLWDWAGDFQPPQDWAQMYDSSLYQINLDSYDFHLPFASTQNARYIRFKVFNAGAGIIWETRAWGTLQKIAWAGDVFDHQKASAPPVSVMPFDIKDCKENLGNMLQCWAIAANSGIILQTQGNNRIKDLKIYDLSGRLIYTAIPSQPKSQIMWNGCDNIGRKVVNGNYFVKLNTLEGQALPRVNLAR